MAQARKFSGPKGATGHSAGELKVRVVVWPSALSEGELTLKGTAELSTLRGITGGGQPLPLTTTTGIRRWTAQGGRPWAILLGGGWRHGQVRAESLDIMLTRGRATEKIKLP